MVVGNGMEKSEEGRKRMKQLAEESTAAFHALLNILFSNYFIAVGQLSEILNKIERRLVSFPLSLDSPFPLYLAEKQAYFPNNCSILLDDVLTYR